MPHVTYPIEKSNLVKLATEAILVELQGHCEVRTLTINFPDVFLVEIDTGCDEDDMFRYKNEGEEEPFLIMGAYDTGVYATAAMFQSVGELLKSTA